MIESIKAVDTRRYSVTVPWQVVAGSWDAGYNDGIGACVGSKSAGKKTKGVEILYGVQTWFGMFGGLGSRSDQNGAPSAAYRSGDEFIEALSHGQIQEATATAYAIYPSGKKKVIEFERDLHQLLQMSFEGSKMLAAPVPLEFPSGTRFGLTWNCSQGLLDKRGTHMRFVFLTVKAGD